MVNNLPGEDKRTGARRGGSYTYDKKGRLMKSKSEPIVEVKNDAPVSDPKKTDISED